MYIVEHGGDEEQKRQLDSYISDLTKDCVNLFKLISRLTHRRIGYDGEDSHTFFSFDFDEMSRYLDVSEAIDRLHDYYRDDNSCKLSQGDKKNIVAFLAYWNVKDEPHRDSIAEHEVKDFAKRSTISLE